MLPLAAIVQVCNPQIKEDDLDDLIVETTLRVGQLGLTVIALVFVLVTLWQR